MFEKMEEMAETEGFVLPLRSALKMGRFLLYKPQILKAFFHVCEFRQTAPVRTVPPKSTTQTRTQTRTQN